MCGYVYFIGEQGTDNVKIGYTSCPYTRLKQLQTANPLDLRLLSFFKAAKATERDLHKIHEEIRLRGEWFSDDGRIATLIKHINDNFRSLQA